MNGNLYMDVGEVRNKVYYYYIIIIITKDCASVTHAAAPEVHMFVSLWCGASNSRNRIPMLLYCHGKLGENRRKCI